MTAFDREGLETLVESVLANEGTPTPEKIREIIARLLPVSRVSPDEAEQIARVFEARHGVTMTLGSALVDPEFKPWLDAERANIDFYYWKRYRRLLVSKHFSKSVVDAVHADTDRTLELLQNPKKDGVWRRRGMVVGHVQSGKTANYIGLACKAADAGYRLIVIIAGVHNNLRNQTQKRIDEGLVGRDSARMLSKRTEDGAIGVALFDSTRRPVTFTTSIRDFNKATATAVGVPLQNLREPAVLVIKKNSNTLKNLIEWIRDNNLSTQQGAKISVPLLLIDDEADNASINVASTAGDISTINGQIRDLLKLFSRSCYVGYTATPFANIFIDPETDDEMRGEDLFPKDFIVSLDPPSNYFGATKVFLDETDRIVRRITDHDAVIPVSHKQTLQIASLPESLLQGLRAFVLAKAIRLLRGHRAEHCSMLVNVSRFTDVQSRVRAALQSELEIIQESVKLHAGLPPDDALRDETMLALYETWKTEYAAAAPDWTQVQSLLIDAASPIKTVEINNRSHSSLNYDEYREHGLNIIAVGGFSLSRGLTLEGLIVSYFLRNSMMYDTLMQMGRWFGYRPDYEDLCRVWMPSDAIGWYAHIAEAIEQLREELREMAVARATPEEFGLKVRAHPETLLVTARNKMGSSEKVVVQIGLSAQLIETATLRADDSARTHNLGLAKRLVERILRLGLSYEQRGDTGSTRLYQGVPVELVKEFVSGFLNHPVSMLTDPGPVGNYIDERAASELQYWDVAIIGLAKATESQDTTLGIPINLQNRTSGRSDRSTLRLSDNRRVASVGTEKFGLSDAEISIAEEAFWKKQAELNRNPNAVSGLAPI